MDPRALLWPLASIAWAAHISFLSTSTFSGDLSRPLLRQFLAFFHLTLSPQAFSVVHVLLRKSAHVTEYLVFGLLLYLSLLGRERFRWRSSTARRAMVAGAVFALFDELHQTFVPGRGASVVDWSIDTAGVTLAMLLLYGAVRLSAGLKQPS